MTTSNCKTASTIPPSKLCSMANSENVSVNISMNFGNLKKRAVKSGKRFQRRSKYFDEPLFTKMMEAIRDVRENSRGIMEVADARNFPERTLRRYVELSMNADIVSPFYFPMGRDEIPIGRKLQQQQKQKQTEMAHKRGKPQPTMPSIGKAADSNAATATTSLQTPVLISEGMHREPAAMYRCILTDRSQFIL